MASKTKFVQALLVHATALSTAGAGLDDLREVYLDRDYGTTNLIGEEDVAPLGLTVAQVEALVAIIPGFLIYVNETTVREALNSARTDV